MNLLYRRIVAGIFFFGLLFALCAPGPIAAQESSSSEKSQNPSLLQNIAQEYTQKVSDFFANLKTYVSEEKKTGLQEAQTPLDTTFVEALLIFCTDLAFSLFCLWLTMWILVGVRKYNPAPYLWFIAMFNLSWYVALWLFRGIWHIISVLIISHQPDLEPLLLGQVTLCAFCVAAILYVWLLARIFQLQLFGAIKAFCISHAFYILFAFFFVSFPYFNQGPGRVFKEGLKLSAAVHTYVAEVNEVAYGTDMLRLKKIRLFHL
ncbi:MAG: hypothetical protein C4540_06935 [Candidatus Omnitrophota bacterium]|jgi:hypothetical protein|nr:MAG: hypothetical protein C4540_06935 [Candidatus Omnitrophota bacterium]